MGANWNESIERYQKRQEYLKERALNNKDAVKIANDILNNEYVVVNHSKKKSYIERARRWYAVFGSNM